jgi:hypothetical protein
MNGPRALTPEELTEQFMDTCRATADFWADPAHSPEASWPDRVRGLLHSFLVILDGGNAGLPAFDLIARPHPDDKAFHQEEGENWVADGTLVNDLMLHEMLYERAWTVHRGPYYGSRDVQ